MSKTTAVFPQNFCSIEWYRARIIDIYASDGTFSVEFDDGDINEGLSRHCLRVFKYYKVGETVEVRYPVDQDGWNPCEITDDYGDDHFEVRLFKDDRVLKKIHPSLLRRSSSIAFAKKAKSKLSVGSRVVARFEKGMEWFPGRISLDHSDDTYGIDYDDGDFELHVDKRMIKTID